QARRRWRRSREAARSDRVVLRRRQPLPEFLRSRENGRDVSVARGPRCRRGSAAQGLLRPRGLRRLLGESALRAAGLLPVRVLGTLRATLERRRDRRDGLREPPALGIRAAVAATFALDDRSSVGSA